MNWLLSGKNAIVGTVGTLVFLETDKRRHCTKAEEQDFSHQHVCVSLTLHRPRVPGTRGNFHTNCPALKRLISHLL